MARETKRRTAKAVRPEPESILAQAGMVALGLLLWFGLPYLLGTLYQMGVIS